MNRPCPAHGFRRLGLIAEVEHMGRGREEAQAKAQLLAIYKAGLKHAGQERNDAE